MSKKVANGRAVGWGIVADRRVVDRVWQVIAATAGDRRQAPVVVDELQNRNMVCIVVGNVARAGVCETTIRGMRVPSPKKSSGCTCPES